MTITPACAPLDERFSAASPFGSAQGRLWQRCQFHLQQNASAYVPRQAMLKEVAADIRTIFNAPDRPTAEVYLARTIQKYAKSASKLAAWLEANLPEGLTVFDFPVEHRRRVRTTNGLERVNREIARRTKVVGIFPNEAACLRLTSAIVMERDEDWQTGRVYLRMEKESPPQSSWLWESGHRCALAHFPQPRKQILKVMEDCGRINDCICNDPFHSFLLSVVLDFKNPSFLWLPATLPRSVGCRTKPQTGMRFHSLWFILHAR